MAREPRYPPFLRNDDRRHHSGTDGEDPEDYSIWKQAEHTTMYTEEHRRLSQGRRCRSCLADERGDQWFVTFKDSTIVEP